MHPWAAVGAWNSIRNSNTCDLIVNFIAYETKIEKFLELFIFESCTNLVDIDSDLKSSSKGYAMKRPAPYKNAINLENI